MYNFNHHVNGMPLKSSESEARILIILVAPLGSKYEALDCLKAGFIKAMTCENT